MPAPKPSIKFGLSKRFDSPTLKSKAQIPGPQHYRINEKRKFDKLSSFFSDKVSRGLMDPERRPGAIEIIQQAHKQVRDWNREEEKEITLNNREAVERSLNFNKMKKEVPKGEKNGARYHFKDFKCELFQNNQELEPKKRRTHKRLMRPFPSTLSKVSPSTISPQGF